MRNVMIKDDYPVPEDATRPNEPARPHLLQTGPRTLWQPRGTSLRLRAFLVVVAADFCAIVLSFAASAALRGTFWDPTWLKVIAMLVPVFLVVALNGHAYGAQVVGAPGRAPSAGVRALVISLAIVLLMAYYLKTSTAFPRLTVALGASFALFSIGMLRYHIARNIVSIIGGDPYSSALIWESGQPKPAANFSAIITADSFLDPERHDPVMYDELARALARMNMVVVSCHPDRRLAWAHALKGANIQSQILMPELNALAPLGTSTHGGITSLVVARGPLGVVDRAIKRGFDLAFASGVLILLSPLIILTMIVVKLESRGPVFFRQKRIGRGNEVFHVLKFRSMRVAAEDQNADRLATRDDDRITRVGRFIRSTSIDELPQLLNVLSGSMSIVGPRPHALGAKAADKLYWEVDHRYWHRHAAKPGMTGLAQIRGYRGATVAEDDLRNRLQADLEYLDTWSIWRDLKIIFMTFQVLIHRNAF